MSSVRTTHPKGSPLTEAQLDKMRICADLLADPAPQVVREIIDEVLWYRRRLRELSANFHHKSIALTTNKPSAQDAWRAASRAVDALGDWGEQ